jgi:hypothetical protein
LITLDFDYLLLLNVIKPLFSQTIFSIIVSWDLLFLELLSGKILRGVRKLFTKLAKGPEINK